MKQLLLLLGLIFAINGFSQPGVGQQLGETYFPKATPSFSSPTAESFQIFGSFPVSQYTGIPDISIPLYELREGDIVLPISLRYNPANRKVHTMPSWVGLGWTLDVGGVITRNMRGSRDENAQDVPSWKGLRLPRGYMFNHHLWENLYSSIPDLHGNVLDERSVCPYSGIPTLFGEEPEILDHLPDEFHFNFMGYSGMFYYDKNSGSFVVNSEDDIRVAFEYTSGQNIRGHRLLLSTFSEENYLFRFDLTTPDGMRYTFGGDVSAVELSAPRQDHSSYHTVTSSWFLHKITSPNGFEVILNYVSSGEILCNLYPHYESREYLGMPYPDAECSSAMRSCPHGLDNIESTVEGQLIYPVYLKEIVFSTGKILFDNSISNAKKYTSEIQNLITPSQYLIPKRVVSNVISNYTAWRKLDAFTLYSESVPLRRFAFSYTESPDERLKLTSVTEQALGAVVESKNPYLFQYNSNKLPEFCSLDVDHWGFARENYSFSMFTHYTGSGADFGQLYRSPSNNPNVYLAEILEQITYPTGGYTKFGYEPHTYSKRVSLDRLNLEPAESQHTIGGGVRIQSIISVDKANQQNNNGKAYIYTKAQSDSSSGILAFTPVYYREIPIQNYQQSSGLPIRMFNSNMILPVGEAAYGSPVGYSEVLEEERTLGAGDVMDSLVSSTRSYFTNFDGDIYGNKHMDGYIANSGSIYVSNISNTMFIQNDARYRRGKPVMERLYRRDGALIRETRTQYADVPINSGAQIWFQPFYYYRTCSFRGYKVDADFSVSIPNVLYLPVSKTIATYDSKQGQATGLPLTVQTNYTYNSNRLLSSESSVISEEDVVETQIFYPDDYVSNGLSLIFSPYGALASMKKTAGHQINRPIEVRELVNGFVRWSQIRVYGHFLRNLTVNPLGTPYMAKPRFDYQLKVSVPLSQLPRLSYSYSGEATVPSSYLKTTTYDAYDAYGNLRSCHTEDGLSTCIIWGYRHTRPVAYIQHATWSQVLNVLSAATISSLEQSTNSDYIHQTLSTLRHHSSMREAYVYTYTYKLPFGISAIVDPTGTSTYYEYDNFGRLTSAKDHHYQILEQIIYNYKN